MVKGLNFYDLPKDPQYVQEKGLYKREGSMSNREICGKAHRTLRSRYWLLDSLAKMSEKGGLTCSKE